MMDTYLYALS